MWPLPNRFFNVKTKTLNKQTTIELNVTVISLVIQYDQFPTGSKTIKKQLLKNGTEKQQIAAQKKKIKDNSRQVHFYRFLWKDNLRGELCRGQKYTKKFLFINILHIENKPSVSLYSFNFQWTADEGT